MFLTGGYFGLHKGKKLTKHVWQPGKSSLQVGILPSFWLLILILTSPIALSTFFLTSSLLQTEKKQKLNSRTVQNILLVHIFVTRASSGGIHI